MTASGWCEHGREVGHGEPCAECHDPGPGAFVGRNAHRRYWARHADNEIVARKLADLLGGLDEHHFLAASVDQLNEALRILADAEPPPPTTGDETPATGPSSWVPVDMGTALDQPPPEPLHLRYDDSTTALLYPGRDHVLYGPSESGKSWVAFIAATQALTAGYRVAIIDFEDDARGVGERLRLLGTDHPALVDLDRFRYVNPHEPVGPDRAGRFPPGAAHLADLLDWAPDVVIVDGVTEGLAYEGLSEMSATDVAAWFGLISRRFRDIGAAVILIDHTAKTSTDGKPTELGTQHKRGGINGASYFIDVVRRPGRALGGDPVTGLLRLRLAKDRAGWLRGRYPGDLPVVADIDLTAWPDGGITWHILPGGTSATTATDPLAEAIVDYLLVSGGRPGERGESGSAIAVGIGRSRTDSAVGGKLTEMVREGHLTRVDGPRGAKLHALTEQGLEHYDNGEEDTE